MGKKIRSRKSVQRPAAARSRAKARVLGGRKPKRRRTRTEVSQPYLCPACLTYGCACFR